jgi:hypothetical protein
MRNQRTLSLSLFAVGIFIPMCSASSAAAQDTAALPAILQAIDPSDLATLRGNVPPLARAEYDQGAVPDSQPLHRMLLLLQRSAAKESALRQLLDDQQNKFSPSFHTWLTPEQFGAQFGPAAADVQTITSWLADQGFHVNRISAGNTVIEFDGTAGQVRKAFHTQIHRYVVAGKEHTANASDPEIPAALASVVAGVVSLNNFPAVSHALSMGTFEKSRATGAISPVAPSPLAARPLYTPPSASNTFLLAPADFATIYNVTPLWNTGIDGTGQSIAIIGGSNINVSDIQNFRALFGLSNNFTTDNVIVDGIDPGILNGDETEADLDIEWSGAVAKNATIRFVIAAATEVTGGTHLAALYAVDRNVAGVLSESFGNCEQSLGTVNNQYYSGLWEQAAAQGMTVVLSAGDGGSAGCDDFNVQQPATRGLAVSGYASTPFNVAVGGTDFDQIDKWTQYWSATNDPTTFASALGYIPEIPWNDSCAQLGLTGCGTSELGGDLINIVAGSGGASTIYNKPLWQNGLGVPADNKRDLPDVSLFASNGFTGTGYLVCESDQGAYCQLSGTYFSYLPIGGTSASAPSFAGILALINQSQAKQNFSNRQGNANYVLYALAKKQANVTPALNCNASANPVAGCTFNDITKGNSFLSGGTVGSNSVVCNGGTPNCSATIAGTDGILVSPANAKMPAWTTNTGYDLATGLGSVNAQNLATNWANVNSVATSTTLSLNNDVAVNITHGSPVNISVSVSPKNAVGDVGLIATLPASPALPGGESLSVTQLTLANGSATGSTSNLPGGASYVVTAHYQGDGTNAPSDSPGVTVKVAPEPSKTYLTVPTFNPSTGQETTNLPATLVYASPYIIHVDVTNSSGSLTQLCTSVNVLSCPSGTVAITDSVNGAPPQALDAGTFALNSAGYTEDQLVQLSGGTHVLAAQYSGDNSFTKSAAAAYNLTITPAPTSAQVYFPTANAVVGQSFTLFASISTSAIGGAVPTGTVIFYDGASVLPGMVNLSGVPGSSPSLNANLAASLSTGGLHNLSAKYSGDSNYAPASASIAVQALYPTVATVSLNPSSIVYGNSVTITATINTAYKTPAMTGTVTFFSSFSGNLTSGVTQTTNSDTSGDTQIVATLAYKPQAFDLVQAQYSGDANYNGSAQAVSVPVITPDFAVSSAPTILITAGQTGTATITITPASNLASTVMLTCVGNLPAGSTCSITPSAVNLANGVPATAVVSVTSVGPSSTGMAIAAAQRRSFLRIFLHPQMRNPWSGISLFTGLAALFFFLFLRHHHGRRFARMLPAYAAGVFCLVSFAIGCGGGGSGIVQPPPPPPLAVTTTTLSGTMPKVAQGSNAPFTATVTASDTVTGSVTFSTAGSQLSGPYTLVNGSAQTAIPGLPVGATPITASYSGDANNKPSASAAFSQIVTGSTSFAVNAVTGVNIHQLNLTATIQ